MRMYDLSKGMFDRVYRCRSYLGVRTELTQVSGTGSAVVPKLVSSTGLEGVPGHMGRVQKTCIPPVHPYRTVGYRY